MKTVLVPGAGTGPGLAQSELLIRATDFHLVLTARKEAIDRFAQKGITESERVRLRPLDVTLASQREDHVKEINDHLGGIEIFRGVFIIGRCIETSPRSKYGVRLRRAELPSKSFLLGGSPS